MSIQNKEDRNESRMAITRKNYIILLVGMLLIVAGFVLMAGGGSDDPNVFNEEMFSWRRISLAPVMVVAGFVVEVFGIMKRY